jgi:A/G-specific adenine glycosylase
MSDPRGTPKGKQDSTTGTSGVQRPRAARPAGRERRRSAARQGAELARAEARLYALAAVDTQTNRLLGRRLLRWYEDNRRDLPWRRRPTPYRVWVSEVMLQQTAVSTVVPYFQRWMRQFRSLAALARASQTEVLALWEGLGYYGRARRLWQAARVVARQHGGRVPRDRRTLLALPGVGPYVADAILSFAFGEDVVALDANVVRVFMRLEALDGAGAEAAVRRRVRSAATAGLPSGCSAQYNQAIMDFGSAVCRPRRPHCGACPLRNVCRAFQQGSQCDIPRPTPKRLSSVAAVAAVFRRGDEVYVQKRPAGGLLAGMWEFPGGKVRRGEAPHAALARECLKKLGIGCQVRRKLTELTHYYTAFRVRLHAYLCWPPDGLPADAEHRWVPLHRLDEYPMPSANRRVVKALEADKGSPATRGPG